MTSRSTSAGQPPYDIAIIGAGVVGCAVARELSGSGLTIAILDAKSDVGDGTSKANTAILHTGFDATPGTFESGMVSRGYELLSKYAERAGIPVEHTGALLVAWSSEEREALEGLKVKAEQNGYLQCQLLDAQEVYASEPNLGPGALGGLSVPDESIICPWTTTLAFATEAVERGAALLLERQVLSVDVGQERTVLSTNLGPVEARWVVNAAGLASDEIDRMFGNDRFTITPRRGELLVYDKLARTMIRHIILPVPSSKGKGVLISPTIFGNVMLGPTAEDLDDKSATETSEDGLEFLLTRGRRIMPDLLDEEVTAGYAGLRAASEHADYIVEVDPPRRYVVLGGIRSTGLTASMALAEHTRGLLAAAGQNVRTRSEDPTPPVMPNLGEASPRPYQLAERIADDAAYGSIVCFCERVTRGEIRDAMSSTIPPRDLDGLRRRTRAMNGRCQGFFCGAEVAAALSDRDGPGTGSE